MVANRLFLTKDDEMNPLSLPAAYMGQEFLVAVLAVLLRLVLDQRVVVHDEVDVLVSASQA